MQLLITEDEAVVFGDCFLRGIGLVGEQDELFQQLHTVALPLQLQIHQQRCY